MIPLHWQKSSFCESGSTCLHLATTPIGNIQLCESGFPGTVLTTTPDRLRPLITRIKEGLGRMP
ncbi:DUF397 domain-containing protein [Streptomyces sp. NPDC020379]|uniref:DUF397 domain-containing protein n=1 Tax=Streptomyces sp. NPDC020379 TaxID=3365071 RepID=UPI0037961167